MGSSNSLLPLPREVQSADVRNHLVKFDLSKKKVKQRIVLREIHLRTTGRHLSMGSHSVICHPTEVTAPPSSQPPQVGTRFIDPVRMKS